MCAAAGAVKVAAELPLELLGPLGCGVLTGAGAMMNALSVRPGSSVAVVGTGTVGLSAIMAAAVRGAKTIVAADLSEERLALARELGATHAINPKNISLTHTLIGVTGYGVDCALDTTGAASVIREILLGLAPRGTCGILGASAAGSEIAVDEVHLMSGGRRLIGIVEGSAQPQHFIPRLIALHQRGLLPFERLVRYYRFGDINQAMNDSEAGRAVKPILRFA